jgi:Leucine-rich repeat (LRR) protein
MKQEKTDYEFITWDWRFGGNDSSKTINYISEYDGSEKLNLACTQLDLPAKRKKEVIQEWCEFLPTLKNVKRLCFFSKVNQDLFDAACQIENLDSLFIKWSDIENFKNIERLTKLRRLYISTSSHFENLSFIKFVKSIQWLELNELKNLSELDGIEFAENLKGFIISGGMLGKQKLKDVEPLSKLLDLEYLGLSSTHIQSDNLDPICQLKNLKYLDLPLYYPMLEYAKIYKHLPNCDHGIQAFRETGFECKNCGSNKVTPMKKGGREFCPKCNQQKFLDLQHEFEKALQNCP